MTATTTPPCVKKCTESLPPCLLTDVDFTFDPDQVRITANGVLLFEAGRPQGRDSEDCFSAETVVLGVELGSGGHSDRHLTCDLTESYVRINADYRT